MGWTAQASIGEGVARTHGDHVMQGRNPFQRDFRKSMLHNGNVYSQWMDRMYEQVGHATVM